METNRIIGCVVIGAALGLASALACAESASDDGWSKDDTKSEANMRELVKVCAPAKYDAFLAQSKAWIAWRTSRAIAGRVNAEVVAQTAAARRAIKPADARPDSTWCKENAEGLDNLQKVRSVGMAN